MKSLSRQEDVQSTKKAMEKAPSFFLNIPDAKTPWYLLSLDYADGYVHWYDIGGNGRRIVCAGGLEGKGFATSECPICAYVLDLYQEAKRLEEEGDSAKAKALKDRANRLHAKPEVQFKAIRGQRTLLKTKTGKEWVADFDMSEEDSTAGVGIISLSESQFSGLTGMINGEGTEFIKNGDDLGKRVLWTAKEKRKGKTSSYSAVVWTADANESDMPEVEVPQELLDMDLAESFVIDTDEIEKVFSLISGQEVETPAVDDAVAMETDSKKEPDNADLDDLDDDVDPIDDFEDDIPEEKPTPAKNAARPLSRPSAPTRPASSAHSTTSAKPGSSGKVRM